MRAKEIPKEAGLLLLVAIEMETSHGKAVCLFPEKSNESGLQGTGRLR